MCSTESVQFGKITDVSSGYLFQMIQYFGNEPSVMMYEQERWDQNTPYWSN